MHKCCVQLYNLHSDSLQPLRFRKLRKDKVTQKVLFPKRRPRHERVNLKELVKKSEEDYIDFQDAP